MSIEEVIARVVDLAFGQTEKKESRVNGETDNPAAQPARKLFDWCVLLTLRSRTVLSGEMWLNTFVSAFVALCVGVIVVVYVFPLGAAWAAPAAFVAVMWSSG
jgi:hypothetical protein